MYVAFFTGCLTGFFIAIPPGPLSLSIVAQGLRRNVKHGVLLGLGGVMSEFIYATIGFFGIHFLYPKPFEFTLRIIGFIFVFMLGIHYTFLNRRTGSDIPPSRISSNPGNSFLTGYLLSFSTPSILAAYVIAANLIQANQIFESSHVNNISATVGAGLGSILWMGILISIVYKLKKSAQSEIIRKIASGLGMILLIFSMYLGFALFMK